MIKNGLYQDKHGLKVWFKNYGSHRYHGPSQITNTYRAWCNNDLIHRLNGFALIWYKPITNYWYISGKDITDQLNDYCHANNINIDDYMNLKKSDKLKLKFKFSLQL